MIECTFLEEADDHERYSKYSTDSSKRELNLRLYGLQEQDDKVLIFLIKNLKGDKKSDIPEHGSVGLRTLKNISFSRGHILSKQYRYGNHCLKSDQKGNLSDLLAH